MQNKLTLDISHIVSMVTGILNKYSNKVTRVFVNDLISMTFQHITNQHNGKDLIYDPNLNIPIHIVDFNYILDYSLDELIRHICARGINVVDMSDDDISLIVNLISGLTVSLSIESGIVYTFNIYDDIPELGFIHTTHIKEIWYDNYIDKLKGELGNE